MSLASRAQILHGTHMTFHSLASTAATSCHVPIDASFHALNKSAAHSIMSLHLLLCTTPAAKHLVAMTYCHPKSENSHMPVGP